MHRLFWSLILVVMLAGCAAPPTPTAQPAPTSTLPASPTPGLRPIRLPVGYIPSVQFAPLYVAMDKGYFAAEGLEVEIDYSFETNGVQLVSANQLPFAIASGEQVLLARAQGLPVVYTLAWFQKFPVAITSKASASITKPADLKGKNIGSPTLQGASYVGLHALLAYAGIKPQEVTITDVGFNQGAALSTGQVDAVVVYANNEPIRLAAQGEKLNTLYVSDYVALAANGLLTNEETIQKDPQLIRAFARALVHGIQDSIADPDGTYTLCKKFVSNIENDEVEKKVLVATIEMWKANRLGYSDPAAWENMQNTLLAAGQLDQPQDVKQAYTNEFVP